MKAALAGLAVLAGAIQTWANRDAVWPDLVSYLDIADAYRRGDWAAAINAHWSPLYSWLLAAAMAVARPSPAREPLVVKAVDFGVFVCSLLTFELMLLELRRRITAGDGRLPEAAFQLCAHAVFLWSALRWLVVYRDTPDMAVAALVYLAVALLLRLQRTGSRRDALVLGTVLGLGYLCKSSMFPMAFVFVALCARMVRPAGRAGLALAGFLVLALPFSAAVSWQKGRPTFGDAARLNYAWLVNPRVPDTHWQGEPAGSGTPRHPTRQIFEVPAAYEFATPIGGTYPPWYDPSYWNEGLRPRFGWRTEMAVLARNALFCAAIFGAALIGGVLLLALAGGEPAASLRALPAEGVLLVPGLIGLAGFFCGTTLPGSKPPWGLLQTRYLGPFVVLLFVGALASLRVAKAPAARRRISVAAGLVAFAVLVRLSFALGQDVERASARSAGKRPWAVADGLHEANVPSGSKVALLGPNDDGYWARLAGVRIVAELQTPEFWEADGGTRSEVLRRIRATGAVSLVSPPGVRRPGNMAAKGWSRLGASDHYLLSLERFSRP
jgi:hypothetical protein